MNAPLPVPTPVAVNPAQPTRKVTWASIASYLGGVALLGAVQGISGHLDVLSAGLPPWANIIITPLIPAVIAFLTGYATQHAPNDVLLPTKGVGV